VRRVSDQDRFTGRPLRHVYAVAGLLLSWGTFGGCNQILGNGAPDGGGGSSGGMGAAAGGLGGDTHTGGSAGSGAGGASTGGAGGTGLGGMGGDVPPPATIDGACSRSGERACDANDEKLTLVCSKGSWVSSGSCTSTDNCAPDTGVCTAIVAECVGLEAGNLFCNDSDEVILCGPNLVSTSVVDTCEGRCVETGVRAVCVPTACGDGFEDETEECDDGNTDNEDDCTELCEPPFCGDGFFQVERDEECDDGEDSAACNADCTIVQCGDAYVNEAAGEDCDEGGPSEDCAANCKWPDCGNGAPDPGEDCDTDGESSTCNENCTDAACGDDIINSQFVVDPVSSSDPTATEQCDPGTGTSGNLQRASANSVGCDRDCTVARCGDGYLNQEAGELCDDLFVLSGPKPDTAGCDSDCTFPECGDGHANEAADELCDDGNSNDADSCDNGCSPG